jgi:hypothetical protein
MDAKYLYLYKVSTRHSPEVYVAAESQAEAVEKVKDDDIFDDEDPFQISVTFVSMVTV